MEIGGDLEGGTRAGLPVLSGDPSYTHMQGSQLEGLWELRGQGVSLVECGTVGRWWVGFSHAHT